MANKQRAKMSAADRAKQFMPFSALHGLEEALASKEREMYFVPMSELSDDEAAVLNEKLASLRDGMNVKVTYYRFREYVSLSGTVNHINTDFRCLFIDDIEICFDDIRQVEFISPT